MNPQSWWGKKTLQALREKPRKLMYPFSPKQKGFGRFVCLLVFTLGMYGFSCLLSYLSGGKGKFWLKENVIIINSVSSFHTQRRVSKRICLSLLHTMRTFLRFKGGYFLATLFIGSNDYGHFLNQKKNHNYQSENRCRSMQCNTLHNNQ